MNRDTTAQFVNSSRPVVLDNMMLAAARTRRPELNVQFALSVGKELLDSRQLLLDVLAAESGVMACFDG